MKFDYLKLAEIIKNRRIELKITTRELAEKVGISHGEISKFENGVKANFYFFPLIKMCKELNLDLVSLFKEVGLYEQCPNKNYYVFFKGKIINRFKVYAKNEQEAMDFATRFVFENELIELDNDIKNIFVAVVECESSEIKIVKKLVIPEEEPEDIFSESDECEDCPYYCYHCGECLYRE